MYDWHGGWGPGEWVAMGLMMLVFWGLIAGLVVYVVRSVGRDREAVAAPNRADDPAMRILDERFARGDIDADEYGRRRDVLRTR